MSTLRPKLLVRDALVGFGFGLLVALCVGWVASTTPSEASQTAER